MTLMLSGLIAEIDEHLAWRAAQGHRLAETTLGLRAVDDGKLMSRLRDGRQITVDKMQRIRAWLAADREAIEAMAANDAGPEHNGAAA